MDTQSSIIYVDDNGSYNNGCDVESSSCKNLTCAIYYIWNRSSVAVNIKPDWYGLLAPPITVKNITIKKDGEGVVEKNAENLLLV